MQVSATTIADALEHAGTCQPLESCGVVTADGSFIPIPNLATEPGHFIMDRRMFCRVDVKRKARAIVHSHVGYPPVAGDSDRSMCEKSGLPWIIISWPDGHWNMIEPEGWKAPLVGREWQWGSHDCYTLCRDALQSYTGILVPEHSGDWMFWRHGRNLIVEGFQRTGFISLPLGTPPRQCDIFGMAISSEVVNHLAVFLEPDRILHQLYRKLSVRETYGGLWLDRTRLHLRHERLM